MSDTSSNLWHMADPLFKKEFAEKVQKVVQESDSRQGQPSLRQQLAHLHEGVPSTAAALWAQQLEIAVCTQLLAAQTIYPPELKVVENQQREKEKEREEKLSKAEDPYEKASLEQNCDHSFQRHEVEEAKTQPSLSKPTNISSAEEDEQRPKRDAAKESELNLFAESEEFLYDEEITTSDEALQSAVLEQAATTPSTEAEVATKEEEAEATSEAEEASTFSPEELRKVRADFLQRFASGNLTEEEQAFVKELEKSLPQGDYSMQAKNPNILETKTFSQVAIDGNR